MIFRTLRGRTAATLTVFGLAGALAACDNTLLEVKNPGAVNETDLNDPAAALQVVNSVVGSFQSMYDDLVFAGALLGDEGDNGHNFEQWRDINLRKIDEGNSVLSGDIYIPLQTARAAGDDLSERLKAGLGDKAATDLNLARMLAYAGYSNVMLGEYFCQAPVKDTEGALSSEDILKRSITRFDEAIQIASAAKAAGIKAATADTIINLSRVGAARASMGLGDKAKASAYASQVPASFVMWSNYSDNKSYQENRLYGASTGSNPSLGVAKTFRDLNDPRIRHTPTTRGAHNPDAIVYLPYQASSHSGWKATGDTVRFEKNTKIRFASGLEAQYIVAEAQGANATNIAFINSRRAVGNMPALDAGVSEADFQAALRDQRRRDFFLDGHRLGDLRRYKKFYDLDLFNKGQHPVAKWGNYDLATCFVPSRGERTGNPNYK